MKSLLEEFGPVNEAGKSYGIMKIKSRPYDFSFPRKEKKSGITRKDYEIVLDPFADFKEAQKRRDLTINSLMYSFEEEKIIDNFNGVNDLNNKIIRIIDPVTFPEDPLRVYRIAQFISRLGFVPDKETAALCKKMDIGELSVERIQWEMDKLLKGQYIREGIEFLFEPKYFKKDIGFPFPS
jgi:tRNA nucleotidyltransferase (CCA-adding enzyme)